MKSTILLIAILIIALLSLLFAQDRQIQGSVKDETGTAIPDASISNQVTANHVIYPIPQ